MQVVAALKDRGMWENTLLVAAADNGGPLGSVSGIEASEWDIGTSPDLMRHWLAHECGIAITLL